ncbi:MAG: GGDEF domain-containing protein [Gemmatimonadetes bacterium]|nr:GGDEF domain-containing protein [Gemmatimonadota bacterium]
MARVRVVAMGLLLIAPTWNIVRHPDVPMFVSGFVVTLVAALISVVIWRLVSRREWRLWIGFASSAFDVTMVSTALFSFFLVSSPLVALNSKVTFEMYFLAITATSLRYDARICIAAGALAAVQYGAMWVAGGMLHDLRDPSLVADAGPYLPVDLATRLLLIGIATLLSVTLVQRAQRLLYLAARDRLTGLFNRGHFDRALELALESASRSGQPLSLAILDIDHFKEINDAYGHSRGDRALRALADRLANTMRRTDIVARYGGEEFVVLMPGTPPEAALMRIESLRLELAATPLVLSDGRTIALNFSAGVAGAPTDGGIDRTPLAAGLGEPDALLMLADERLLEAKRSGRARTYGPGTTLTGPPPARRSTGAYRVR